MHIQRIQIVLVDRDDNIKGYKEKFEAHHNPVPLHRAISVLIYDKSGQKMLLQKRSLEKPTWPGFWSNATCTHPLPNESYKGAAVRRLREEMGINTDLKEKGQIIYKSRYNSVWGEHELDHVFAGLYDGKIVPDPREVAEWKWMEVDILKKDLKKNPRIYTPWFKLIFNRLLL